MALESKQYADLIRHRELNALRRLMVQRNPPEGANPAKETTVQSTRFKSSHAIEKINALEVQMNNQLFELSSNGSTFQATQIMPVGNTVTLPTTPPRDETTIAQEAGEHFAHNRMIQAQTCLEQAIGSQGRHNDHVPTWLTLLDFYRATDQAERFDALALDFSIRFGRSTPSWLSIPNQAELALRERTPAPLDNNRCSWAAPTHLSQAPLLELERSLQLALQTSQLLEIDWRSLISTDSAQWERLKVIFQQLASHPFRCVMYGTTSLEHAFNPASEQSVLARLALLRCQNQPQAFEDLAIDYCTEFEVSPPDWVVPVCQLKVSDTLLFDGYDETIKRTKDSPADALAPELFGVLEHELAPNTIIPTYGLTIRCDRLVRCGAVATASLVQWAKNANNSGFFVEFKGVHRLIAAYFLMQGISEYAKVTLRPD